jgi:uncharacterized membrane protein
MRIMIKWILAFILAVFIIGLTLDVFAQAPIIVVDPTSGIKQIIIVPPPPPTWN